MSRANHLYLPRLSEDANIGEPDRAGRWENYERRVLRGISNGIIVDEQARVRGISSVPDIWARPLMFRAAIQPGSRHPLRARMVQEWRGLMSLLALREVQGYDVEIVPVRLDQGRFARSLQKLGPGAVQLEAGQAYRWTDVLMIRYEDIPIGAFSPTTLVYTSIDYHHRLKDTSLSLQQRDERGEKTGYLAPPEHLEEKFYVAEWLFGLKERLSDLLNREETHPDHRVSSAINELMAEWLEELRDELGEAGRGEIDAPEVMAAEDYTDYAPSWSPLDGYRVYQELLRPLILDPEHEWGSEMTLDLDPERNHTPYDLIVVITESLLRSEAQIWGMKRLRHLGGDVRTALRHHFDAAAGTRIAGNEMVVKDRGTGKEKKALWVRPERYFLSDVLLKAPGSEPFLTENEHYLNGGRRLLLPFKKEILDFFSPEDIKNRLRSTFKDTDDGVKFTFQLPVAGREEKVEKVYRRKNAGEGEGHIEEIPAPVVELFPNYLGEYWHRYYLFQGDVGAVTVNPVVYGENRIEHRSHTDRMGEERRALRVTGIQGEAPFPEGLELELAAGRATPCGLILIEKPASGARGLTGPERWRVGIDFGTSNTNIFRYSGNPDDQDDATKAQMWQFNFKDHLRSVTASTDEAREPLLERYFVPDRAARLPMPTSLRVNRGDGKKLMLDYFAFFSSAYELPENVRTDIKWQGDSDLIDYFVESLLFLVLLGTLSEKVRNLKIACSYPEAFSIDIEQMFRRAWRTQLHALTRGEDRVLIPHSAVGDEGVKIKIEAEPSFENEGLAAGTFFASKGTIPDLEDIADKEGAAVCLDVGGGTTDVSIWYNNNIVYSASVLLAGRQIAAYLQKNARLRELFFSKEAAEALQNAQNDAQFAARLNAVLRKEEHRVRDLLAKYGSQDEVKKLRQIIAIEFGALAFYTAALIGAADRTEKGAGLLDWIADERHALKLHWGGNAAKLITWIDYGRFDKNGIAAKVLTAIFYNALKDLGLQLSSDRLGQVKSPAHKSEAAGGLAVMKLGQYRDQAVPGIAGGVDPHDMADQHDMPGEGQDDMPREGQDSNGEAAARADGATGVVCGENIEVAGEEVAFTDLLTSQMLFGNGEVAFEQASLERFTRFIEMVNFFGTRYGLISEDMKVQLTDSYKRTIAREVRASITRAQAMSDKQRVIEPVFIMEVKALLGLI